MMYRAIGVKSCRLLAMGMLALTVWAAMAAECPAAAAEGAETRVLVVVGPSKHPPGTHEVEAGARVIEYLLEHAEGIPPVRADIVSEWPEDKEMLEKIATIVFIGDLFPGETLENPGRVKSEIGELLGRGCGIVCVHYATGLRAQQVTESGDHPLLGWLGGYFASGCPHHRSVARVVKATLSPEESDHPVLRGWKPFTFDDEPYWNNYFGPNGPAENVTPLVWSMLPPEAPKKETVGWAVQREDGGRGMGIVVPHFYRNWAIDDLRILVLNGICWTAKIEIPAEGVRTETPDLAKFGPAAVEPKPQPKR